MSDKTSAVAFVGALLDVAGKKGVQEQIEKDLELVCGVIAGHTVLRKLFFHPCVTRDEKNAVIRKLFGDSISGLMKNFLNVLLDRKREGVLWAIPEILEQTVNEKNGVSKVVVQTAIPITGERLNGLKRRLDKMVGRTVAVEVVKDPSILGGMIVRIGNKIIDGSVAGRLKNLKTRLLAVPST